VSSGEQPGATLWATREQLATRYQVHARTVDEWRRRGILPAFVVSARLVRFPIAECDEGVRRFRHSARWEQKEGGVL
jgi:hypothetical protein